MSTFSEESEDEMLAAAAMSKTFYHEFREKSDAERRDKMLAAAMSSNLRLGQYSSFRKVGSDMLRTIRDLVPIEPLPQLQIVDEETPGISARQFNPRNPGEIDMTLLLSITVSLEGHHQSETIFCGRVLPLMVGGLLHMKTLKSKGGYYHECLIERLSNDRFSVKIYWNNYPPPKRYGRQEKTISDQNTVIKQDTPQGLSVEIRSLLAHSPQMLPTLVWPSSMPMVHPYEGNVSGFFYDKLSSELSPHDQNFEFSVWLAGNEVFRAPLLDPANPTRTIGCKLIDDECGENIAETGQNTQELRRFLYLDVTRWGGTYREDMSLQRLYLDDPKPMQQMRQDLLGGYLSFRVERVF
jgi:hypothetical protein